MELIQKCTKSGFHKHLVDNEDIFEECMHIADYDPGANGIVAKLVDLSHDPS
jgi:hypothetical protein